MFLLSREQFENEMNDFYFNMTILILSVTK
jgi:hypothetical protein